MGQLKNIMQIASIVLAGAAAVLWFASARVRTPATFPVMSTHTAAYPIAGEQIVFGGASVELEQLGKALRRQSRLGAWGAVTAGLSTLAQATATWLQ